MSTKKLSRTVIEGGRHGSNKWERRHSHAELRADEREYLKQVITDPELADDIDIDAIRPVMKEFTDKLSPMYRWLDSQVDRPWSEVRSEIFTKFDTRTTAGRHITFDHLLRDVVETLSGFDKHGNLADPNIPKAPSKRRPHRYSYSYHDYYVDQGGILRGKEDRNKRYYRKWEAMSETDYKDAEGFLQGRMIGERGGKLYWFAPSEDIWRASWFDPETHYYDSFYNHKLQYYILDNGEHETTHTTHSMYSGTYSFKMKTHSDYWKAIENPFSFRQRGELTQEETKKFKALKYKLRNDILQYSEGR